MEEDLKDILLHEIKMCELSRQKTFLELSQYKNAIKNASGVQIRAVAAQVQQIAELENEIKEKRALIR